MIREGSRFPRFREKRIEKEHRGRGQRGCGRKPAPAFSSVRYNPGFRRFVSVCVCSERGRSPPPLPSYSLFLGSSAHGVSTRLLKNFGWGWDFS